MHRTGQVTEGTGLQRAADGEKWQKVFCDITREHPAEIYSKPGRGLHVTGEAVWLRQC